MEALSWLNLLLLPVFYLQLRIEHRLTKSEARISGLERSVYGDRRAKDFQSEGG